MGFVFNFSLLASGDLLTLKAGYQQRGAEGKDTLHFLL